MRVRTREDQFINHFDAIAVNVAHKILHFRIFFCGESISDVDSIAQGHSKVWYSSELSAREGGKKS